MMLRIDHIQLSIPKGAEEKCRPFYAGLLGLREVPKPPILAGRGGLWLESEGVKLHLGVEEDFRAARKAHPAFAVSDIDALSLRLSEGGCEIVWDDAIPGTRRFYTSDPVGNRIEFMEA